MALDAPILTDGVVTLRPHQERDLADMVAMGTDPVTIAHTTVPLDFDESTARGWAFDHVPGGWADGSMFGWAVTAEDGGTERFAGNLDIRLGPPPDVGFATAPWARGRGYTSRALRLAARWAFDVGEIEVLHWAAHVGHFASWRVAHAVGFTFDGPRARSLDHRGELRDSWWAHLLPTDTMEPRTTWFDTPVLEGETVRLRPHAEADVPRIVEACTDPQTRHWLSTMPDPYTEDSAREYLQDKVLRTSLGKAVGWAVVDRETDVQLANVGLFDMDQQGNPDNAEIGYWVHPDARGRGVMKEAVALALNHAFTPLAEGGLGRRRVQLVASWENGASRRIAEASGFSLVGHHRADGVLGDGTNDDGAWYDLLREDHLA